MPGRPKGPLGALEPIASGQQFGLHLELNWLRLVASNSLLDLFMAFSGPTVVLRLGGVASVFRVALWSLRGGGGRESFIQITVNLNNEF